MSTWSLSVSLNNNVVGTISISLSFLLIRMWWCHGVCPSNMWLNILPGYQPADQNGVDTRPKPDPGTQLSMDIALGVRKRKAMDSSVNDHESDDEDSQTAPPAHDIYRSRLQKRVKWLRLQISFQKLSLMTPQIDRIPLYGVTPLSWPSLKSQVCFAAHTYVPL